MEVLIDSVNDFIARVNKLEVEQAASVKTRKYLEDSINSLVEKNKANIEALDIATHAIEILREVSDEAVKKAYQFLEQSLNASLQRMFTNTVRKIRLKEYTRNNQYPQLEIELTVANGKVRSLKTDSGHGLAQTVSLLSILSLIVITNSRRILVMDEIISGLSDSNLEIINEILWTFTEIGFQFIITEHGFIPKGAKVYKLGMIGDVSSVRESYIEKTGVYLHKKEETVENENTPIKPNYNTENKVTTETKNSNGLTSNIIDI